MKKETLKCGCVFTFHYAKSKEGLVPCQGYFPCEKGIDCELNKE